MENNSWLNCSVIENRSHPYWYFQISFIVIVYPCICIINSITFLVSLSSASILRASQTWILLSCYMSGFLGALSAGSNEFYQSYRGVLNYKCVTFWDRRILSTAGAQVGMYSVFALSLGRLHAVRNKTPAIQRRSRTKLTLITMMIWFAAFATSSVGKSVKGTAGNIITHIVPLVVPLGGSIILQCIIVKKLRQSSVMAAHAMVRRRTERAGTLVSTLVVVYFFVFLLAAISGACSKYDLPRLAIWLARVMHILCYSTEAVVFLWSTPETRQSIKNFFTCVQTHHDDTNQVQPAVIPNVLIVVRSASPAQT